MVGTDDYPSLIRAAVIDEHSKDDSHEGNFCQDTQNAISLRNVSSLHYVHRTRCMVTEGAIVGSTDNGITQYAPLSTFQTRTSPSLYCYNVANLKLLLLHYSGRRMSIAMDILLTEEYQGNIT